jgi:hypothetical protein
MVAELADSPVAPTEVEEICNARTIFPEQKPQVGLDLS